MEEETEKMVCLFNELCFNFEEPEKYILDYAHLRFSTTEADAPPVTPPSSTPPNFQEIMGFQELMQFEEFGREEFMGQNGDNITVIDCETAWCIHNSPNFTADFTSIIPFVSDNSDSLKHGTKVRSVLTSNYSSVKPLCPNINFIGSPKTDELIENSILLAIIKINSLSLNGIILIEQHYRNTPIESLPSVFLVLKLANALNITVIEPAGNSRINLDTHDNRSTWIDQNSIDRLNAISRKVRREGSFKVNNTLRILVESVTRTTLTIIGTIKRRRLKNPYGKSGAILVGGYTLRGTNFIESNNRGNVIDCFAQGVNVPTFVFYVDYLGVCSLSVIEEQFSNTSAASAIIAGMVAIIQSISLSHNGYLLSPSDIKLLISRNAPTTGLNVPNIMTLIQDSLLLGRSAP